MLDAFTFSPPNASFFYPHVNQFWFTCFFSLISFLPLLYARPAKHFCFPYQVPHVNQNWFTWGSSFSSSLCRYMRSVKHFFFPPPSFILHVNQFWFTCGFSSIFPVFPLPLYALPQIFFLSAPSVFHVNQFWFTWVSPFFLSSLLFDSPTYRNSHPTARVGWLSF